METTLKQALRDIVKNVEIEVGSRCNRRCSYCPVSIMPIPKVPKFIVPNVLDTVIERLREIDYAGRISFHFYNEPLLHKDLEAIVRKIADRLPQCKQILFTNGDLLTQERYESLMEAGVWYIVITSHDNKMHPGRPRQMLQFSEDLELTNRGGKLLHLPESSEDDRTLRCYAPSEMLVVTITGEVVLCYEDANREHVVGNLREQSIEELWYSEPLASLRAKLESGDRVGASEMCAKCTNRAHSVAGKSHRSEPFWDTVDY